MGRNLIPPVDLSKTVSYMSEEFFISNPNLDMYGDVYRGYFVILDSPSTREMYKDRQEIVMDPDCTILQDLFDEFGDLKMYYNYDTNDFETPTGNIVYNLWDFFNPNQISAFKHTPGCIAKNIWSWQFKRFIEVIYL